MPGNGPILSMPAGGRRGFTLLELMIGMAIVGILAAIAVPSYTSYLETSKGAGVTQEIQGISFKLYAIASENPDLLPEDQAAFIAYLQKAGLPTVDRWDNPYVYLRLYNRPENANDARKDHSLHPINSLFDLYSMGPDGKSVKPLTGGSSQDDIILANDGAYIGSVSSYPDR